MLAALERLGSYVFDRVARGRRLCPVLNRCRVREIRKLFVVGEHQVWDGPELLVCVECRTSKLRASGQHALLRIPLVLVAVYLNAVKLRPGVCVRASWVGVPAVFEGELGPVLTACERIGAMPEVVGKHVVHV